MKTRATVLEARKYNSWVTPPATFEDTSRFGNDGTHTNITWVRLPSGLWVRSFNGTTSLVNCGSDVSLDDVQFPTLKAWIYPLSLGEANGGRIFDKNQRHLRIGNVNYVVFVQNFAVQNGGWSTPNGSLTLNAWQQVIATYDATVAAPGADPVIYINGVSQAITEILTPNGAIQSDAGSNLIIGNNAAASATFDGYIVLEEFLVYIRSAGRASQLFEKERHWFGV